MSEKEYVFVGNAQLKTRDYIRQLERQNNEKDTIINKAIDFLEINIEHHCDLNILEQIDLLDILKGEDKE